ncbi:MAG: hypothetical protein WBP55_09270 [Solirubrobacterales bacterium]
MSIVSLTLLLGAASTANAETPADLERCAALSQVIVKPDGKIQASGWTRSPVPQEGCSTNNTFLSPKRGFLTQFRPDGEVDPGFSNGGVKFLPGGPDFRLVSDGQGGSLMAGEMLIKLTANGSPDTAFGTDGEADLNGRSARLAEVQPNGRIVIAGETDDGGPYVARFSEHGEPDLSFGTGGVTTPVAPDMGSNINWFGRIGFDDAGRIVLVGSGRYGPVAMRLLEDGTVDNSFGPDSNGFAAPWNASTGQGSDRIDEISVDADGSFRVYGVVLELYGNRNVVHPFNADGSTAGPARVMGNQASGVFAEVPGAGVATSNYPGRYQKSSTFNIVKDLTGPDPIPEFQPANFRPSPGSSILADLVYSPSDGTLVAVGSSEAFECDVSDCLENSFGVIAKVDAVSGVPEVSFAHQGSALVPANECAFGTAASMLPDRPWNRCRVTPPLLKSKAKFIRGGTQKPRVGGRVKIANVQPKPELMERRLTVTLPGKLKVRSKGIHKRLAVKVNGADNNSIRKSVSGRKITIRVVPDASSYSSDEYGPLSPRNTAIAVNWKLKAGALKKIPKKALRAPLRFKVVGKHIPSSSDYASFGPAIDWFGPNNARVTTKARPVTLKPVETSATTG